MLLKEVALSTIENFTRVPQIADNSMEIASKLTIHFRFYSSWQFDTFKDSNFIFKAIMDGMKNSTSY